MAAAVSVDAVAELTFRIAAVADARRAELASLRWTDERDGQLAVAAGLLEILKGDGK